MTSLVTAVGSAGPEDCSRYARRKAVGTRLGDDEFAVLLPDADLAAAQIVARDIVQRSHD